MWEDYINDLNKLPSDIAVLGINDYLFLDGYKKVKEYFDNGKLPKIKKIFPVIELRLKIFGNQSKTDNWHRINFHVIFSDGLEIETIEAQFISGLSSHYNLLPENQSFWNGVLTKKSLEDFGKMIIKNSTITIKESPLEVGFNSLNFTDEGVFKLLKNHYFKEKYLTAIGKTEWEKLRWDGSIGEKLNIINSVDFVFSASENITAYNNSYNALQTQLRQFNLLDCSDAHYFSSSIEKDRIGNCNQWIKAEPTFEGLKQLKYEPTYRKAISTAEPKKPFRSLVSIKFNFPEKTKLKNIETNSETPFCLTELKDEIFFSPYFTCIIGGRGSGKSTIINIIAEKLGERTDFFKNNKIIVNENIDALKNNETSIIVIDGTNEIEFISQGKVERLSDGNHLTDLIFNERIKAIGNEYEQNEKLLFSKFQLIDSSIKLLNELESLNSMLYAERLSLENDKQIIASIENDVYKELSKKVNQTSTEIARITNSKNQYSNFLSSLIDLMMSPELTDANDEYADRVKEIIVELEKIEEFTKIEHGYSRSEKVFNRTDSLLEKRKAELAAFKQQVIDYFTSIGSTPDIISDVDRATSNIALTSNQIIEIERKISVKKEQLNLFMKQTSEIKDLAIRCEEIISVRLKLINDDLNITNDNVEKIRFESTNDNNKFLNRLYNDFYENFKEHHKANLSWDNIYWCLKELIKPNESFLSLTYKQFSEQLQSKTFDKNSLYGKVFLEIFDSESNFEIYKLIIKRNLYNVSGNVEIVGYYGNSPLTSCSFGQRCTAVVVTLLMTGMKPLIIDEPEAHLDNRLIAEYLVDLIKQKKNERQIIFATHNANFVINGDAELIHILDIPKEKIYTEIISTTIENLDNRKALLKLEGGEEAFKKRDKKLLSTIII